MPIMGFLAGLQFVAHGHQVQPAGDWAETFVLGAWQLKSTAMRPAPAYCNVANNTEHQRSSASV